MKTPKFVLAVWFAFFTALVAQATIGTGLQMQLGNPSSATADTSNHSHYLIERPQYTLDYNDTTREPNWVSWNLTSDDVGGSGRAKDFFVDTTLPAGFYQVLTTDYSGSGYDRGHMCPSADRTVSRADNDVTFYMSNMVPQTPDNNQGVWANFESYCRTLAAAGNEVLITSGTSGFAGSTVASGVAIPGYTWKIVVVVPLGPGSAVSRITAATRVIAIKIPNIAGVRSTPWENFVTSAAQIESDTGNQFFSELPVPVANALRTVVDGQSAAGAPSVTVQPSPQTTVVGGSATFSVTASGDAPLSYQWVHDDTDISGATNATLILSGVQAADVGSYYVVVSNAVGSTTSNAAALVITGLPPVITASPVSQTVNAGVNVTFPVTATGSPTLTYQWRKDGVPLGSATTTATLSLANVQAGDAGSYDVVVTNSVNSAISAVATLTVNAAVPAISGQPVARSATTGGNASFTVTASGTAPLTYQWRKEGIALADGGAISGATTATLLLTGVSAVNGGSYDVVVTNALGFAISSPATLTVNPPAPNSVVWNFGTALAPTAEPTSGLSAEITGGTLTQVNNFGTTPLLTTTSVSTGTGASGAVNAGAATVNGALNLATSTYFQFTLAPVAGKRLLATGLSFRSRSTGTGPQSIAVYSSVDDYTTPVATATNSSGTNWALYTPAFTTVTGLTDTPITFRIYGYNGAGATGSTAVWRIDDLSLTINTVFPPPVMPVVTGTSPATGATGVAVAAPITVTFNEAVSFTGTWFSINSAANGPMAASVTGGPTTYTLTPPSFLANNDTVTVTIFGAQVVDQASGTIHGSGNTIFSFATESYVPPTPPTVTTQPVSQTVFAGANVSFTVAASGTAPLGYQWRKGGTAISGNASAATATLTLSSVSTSDAANYDCVVSNIAGSDVSQAAALTVNLVPPAIASQPAGQMVVGGGNATFTVVATGTAPLTYQWRKGGTPLADGPGISGTGTAALTLTGITTNENGSYSVVVTNGAGTKTSNEALLAVTAVAPSAIYWDFATAAPTSGMPAGVTGGIVTQGNNNGTTTLLTTTSASTPATTFSGGNNAGAAARTGALNKAAAGSAYFEFTFTPDAGLQFAASALSFGTRSTGTGPQAYSVFTSIDGFTTPIATGAIGSDSVWRVITTSFPGVTGLAGTPVTFRIYGHSGSGSPGANTANWRIDDLRLTEGVLAVPVSITAAPVAQTVTVGDNATFTIVAAGSAPFSYQWRKAGVPIAGNATATTDTLVLTNVTTADAGAYDCVVSNIASVAVSDPVALMVNKATATVTLADLDYTYDGAAHAASVSTVPANLPVVLTYDGSAVAPTNAGTYAVVATVDDVDYEGSATGTLTIAKAPATIALGDLTAVYNGATHAATATASPAGLGVALTYDGSPTPPTNAGSYAVVATVIDTNYVGSTSGTLEIAKAVAGVTLSDLQRIYDGAPKAATVTTDPAGVAVSVTYNGASTAPTQAGSYAVVATASSVNYTGSASGTLVIGQTNAAITLGYLAQDYDGTPKSVVVATTPENLNVTVTYNGSATLPVYPGSYAVVATVNDVNYVGSVNDTLVISVTALVRHTPALSGGLDGSLQMLRPEIVLLGGNAWISGDLLVPGTPFVWLSGHPLFDGVVDAEGRAAPYLYFVSLSGHAVLRHVVRRIDALPMPIVNAPPRPTGTRSVTLTKANQSPGNFATLRNLTLNSRVGQVVVPPGTYGNFTANSGSGFVLGVAGATTPSVYNFQNLTLNSNSTFQVVGPVIVTVDGGFSTNTNMGAAEHPEWLTLRMAGGGFTLNGDRTVYALVEAPDGTVILNGDSTLVGRVACDWLIINGNAVLSAVEP